MFLGEIGGLHRNGGSGQEHDFSRVPCESSATLAGWPTSLNLFGFFQVLHTITTTSHSNYQISINEVTERIERIPSRTKDAVYLGRNDLHTPVMQQLRGLVEHPQAASSALHPPIYTRSRK